MNPDDKIIAKTLQEHAYKEGANPWFTPRVMNRLPERQRTHSWVGHAIYIAAAIVCLVIWLTLIAGQDFTVITVRDVTQCLLAAVATAVLLWHTVTHVVRSIE